tara:strand:+ start:281 stop:685 length:405 start_codon:yes stop_codon:yes gene_type:complete
MHKHTAMRVFSLLTGILLVMSAGCQKIPEPVPELPQPAEEKKIQALILSLAGEVGERDPKTGHMTIVILSGDKIDDKVLGEIVKLKRLEILELHDTKVTKKGLKQLRKEKPKLEVILSKSPPGSKPGDRTKSGK